MAENKFVLSEVDVKQLRQLFDEFYRQRGNTEGRHRTTVDDHQAPEVYVVRTPDGGIPGLTVESGAGIEDEPGYADCQVYRIVIDDDGETPYLVEVSTSLKRVYNLSAEAVDGATWILTARDKFGLWFVVGTASETFSLTLQEADGTPSYADVSTIQVNQSDGFSLSNPSPNVVRLNLTPVIPTPTITVKESDGSPNYTGMSTLSFLATDFVVTNPSAAVAQIALTTGLTDDIEVEIPYDVDCGGGVITLLFKTLTITVVNGRITGWSFA